MRRVIIESPFAGKTEHEREPKLRYLRACMRDSLLRGEAPFASHGLYTQPGVLDDNVPAEREHGIQAGFAWRNVADGTVFYHDLGWSRGMLAGWEDAKMASRSSRSPHLAIECRLLGGEWAAYDLADRNDPRCLCGDPNLLCPVHARVEHSALGVTIRGGSR